MTEITPARIEQLTGIPPEHLRDWRRRGFLEGVGVQADTGRWHYRFGDILLLASVNFMVSRRLVSDMKDAFHIAGTVNPYLFAWLNRDDEHGAKWRETRFAAAWVNAEGSPPQVELFRDFEAIQSFAMPGYVVLDLKLIAENMAGDMANSYRRGLKE